MNPTQNCHRLLNKLCGTAEQRDVFASGTTQPRPHTSSCAKLGLVIVFQHEHFCSKMSIPSLTPTKRYSC